MCAGEKGCILNSLSILSHLVILEVMQALTWAQSFHSDN